MRKLKNAELLTIPLSEIEALKEQGYVPLEYGDASKANSDYFMVMIRRHEKKTDELQRDDDIEIVCPSFLRGPLGFESRGCISY